MWMGPARQEVHVLVVYCTENQNYYPHLDLNYLSYYYTFDWQEVIIYLHYFELSHFRDYPCYHRLNLNRVQACVHIHTEINHARMIVGHCIKLHARTWKCRNTCLSRAARSYCLHWIISVSGAVSSLNRRLTFWASGLHWPLIVFVCFYKAECLLPLISQ